MGLKFSNPIGLAAGYDKHGDAIGGCLDLGFGFVEIGSVTPREQPGNPYPRVFRLSEDKAVINRYGFNSHGMERVGSNMIEFSNYRESYRDGLVGINAGKNKDTSEDDAPSDYSSVIERFLSLNSLSIDIFQIRSVLRLCCHQCLVTQHSWFERFAKG